jgi:tight adherence protein C
VLALLLLCGGPCLAVSAFYIAQTVSAEEREREASLRRVTRYGRESGSRRSSRRIRDPQTVLADLARRSPLRVDDDSIALLLRSAGIGNRISVDEFLAIRIAAAMIGGGLGVLVALAESPLRLVVYGPALGAIGYLLPVFVAKKKAQRRRAEIAPALPDALDLVCVCVEAGLSLEGAIQKLVEELHGPLADELDFALGEIRVGMPRHDALQKLAERIDVPELTAVVRAIVLAERHGTPLARTLRVQAAEARDRRQVQAEDDANKAPVKMLFPTVFLIFPALFLAVLGPALLTIARSL